MEANLEKLVRVLDWQELMCKQRSQQEELLMQSVSRLEPAYWTGVKLVEGHLYGTFCFHKSTDAKKRDVSAAFLLDEQVFLLVTLKDEDGMLNQMKEYLSEIAPENPNHMEEGLEAVFDGILKQEIGRAHV